MEDGILVRGTPTRWWMILLRWAGIVGLLVGSAGWFAGDALNIDHELAVVSLVCGGMSLLISETAYAVKALRRRWVRDTGKGFAVRDRAGVREYTDDQVRTIAYSSETVYAEGLASATLRRFTVWTDGPGGERIEMVNKTALGAGDPLAPLSSRVSDLLLARARADLDAGRAVVGDGWTLEKTRLNTTAGGIESALPLDRLSDVDVFDGKVCLWRADAPEPILRIDVGSPGAFVLETLLRERIPPRKSDAPPPAGLGRILFERGATAWVRVFLPAGGLIAVAVGAAIWMNSGRHESDDNRVGAAIAVVCGLLAVGFGWACSPQFFRCCQFGVSQKPWRFSAERTLRYTDIETFTYQAVRHFTNGVYTGTQLSMTFEPFADRGVKRIAYGANLRTGDAELNNLREHISGVIAGRMARELSDRGAADWTGSLRFTADALEYRPSGIFGRKEPVLLPYGDIRAVDIDQGYLYIWNRQQDKYVHSEDCAAANFFPGFILITELLRPDSEPTPTQQESPTP